MISRNLLAFTSLVVLLAGTGCFEPDSTSSLAQSVFAPDGGASVDAPMPPPVPPPVPPPPPPVPPPVPPPPHSTIEISYHDGNPTSMHPTSPSVSQRCWIPKAILDTTPIYNGNPKMTSCDVTTTVVGQPPTSVSTHLYCSNSTGGGGYDYITCSSTVSLVPPSASTTGFISFGATYQTVDLPADSCLAYIARALGICQQTGVHSPAP